MDCNQPCPGHCRNNVTCDHLTGLCNRGCVAGWDGSFCNRRNDFLTYFVYYEQDKIRFDDEKAV